ncbi:MAG: hypothetical protein R2685_02455 [Candidatus Nitrosocosmicus sp.]|nr:hypothetical protein [Candidatus Nitrosocosmicus sp.]
MNFVFLLTPLISLLLFSFLSLQLNNNNYHDIDAITISKNNIYYLSGLPPVGEPVPIPKNPFSTAKGTPEIALEYNNSIYKGELRSAIFSSGDVKDNMPSLGNESNKITAIIPSQVINITNDAQIQLYINANPAPELQPSSLSSTLYHLNGTVYKILSLNKEGKMGAFTVDAKRGNYLLLVTATWLPNPENYQTTSGYVSYIFRVNVI